MTQKDANFKFIFVSARQAIDIFMSSCTVFVFLSLIEYAFVNVMMGDISEVERKDKTSQLRNIIVATNNQVQYKKEVPLGIKDFSVSTPLPTWGVRKSN